MDQAKSQAFADALARARQLAAKLGASGSGNAPTSNPSSSAILTGVKRPLDDYSEPDPKKTAAAIADPFGAQLAAMRGGGAGPAAAGLSIKMGGMTGSGLSCSEEIRIPDPLVGLIIGRGGEQINRIQNETGCKVQLAPDTGSGQDRPCQLQGTKEAIERAKEMVMEIVSSKSHDTGNTRFSAAKAPVGAGVAQGQVELMIPGAKVGLVIGKGGETIRNLQDKSGTKMFILQENMFEECDKPLRIIGEPDLVEHARQLVLEIINDTPKNDFTSKGKSEYGSGGGNDSSGGRYFSGGAGVETMKFPVPKVSVGLIIGKGGEMIKRIQVETGAKVQFDPINSDMGDLDEQLAIITGKPENIRLAQLKIEELVETALFGGKEDGGAKAGGRGTGDVSRGDRSFDRGYGSGRRGDQEEERMVVPSARVGIIIGKGGENIRIINQTSGAHCEIDRNASQDGMERLFIIRGSRSQIEHAKELIMEKVNTQPPKLPRGDSDWGLGGNDRDKGPDATSAQWAAYYAQYYAGGGASAAPAASGGGGEQQDFTQQWIEYFRAQGNHEQADALEKQAKLAKGDSHNPSSVPVTSKASENGGGSSSAAGDYSQQWVEYYRSLGQHEQADQLESYIKSGGSVAASSTGIPESNYNYYGQFGNGGPKGGLTPPGE